jgi:hypothetical protein
MGLVAVVEEKTIGERWYVSRFQRDFTTTRDRQCLCGLQSCSNRTKLVARLVANHVPAFRRDNPNATVQLLDTGHFALAMRHFLTKTAGSVQ